MKSVCRIFAVLAGALFWTQASFADPADTYSSYNLNWSQIRVDSDSALSSQLDSVDTYSGQLSIWNEDVRLPGNGGLDIVVGRSYKSGGPFLMLDASDTTVGDNDFQVAGMAYQWSLYVAPKVILSSTTSEPLSAPLSQWTAVCQNRDFAVIGTGIPLHDSMSFLVQQANGRIETLVPYSNAGPRVMITPTGWRLTCPNQVGTAIFLLQSPDGTRYEMGYAHSVLKSPMYGEPHYVSVFITTKVSDKNGNYYTISYQRPASSSSVISHPAGSGYIPSAINSSDGRQITFAYETVGPTSGVPAYYHSRLSSISDNAGRTWQYHYAVCGDSSGVTARPQGGCFRSIYGLLSQVVLPDGRTWQYEYWQRSLLPANLHPEGLSTAPGKKTDALKRLRYPAGGYVDYDYEFSDAWSNNIWSGDNEEISFAGSFAHTYSTYSMRVVSRTTSDGGVWLYSYAPSRVQGQYDVTTIVGPNGTTVAKHIGIGFFAPAGSWAESNRHTLFPPPQFLGTRPPGNLAWKFWGNYAYTAEGAWRIGLLMEKSIGANYKEVYSYVPREVTAGNTILWPNLATSHYGLADWQYYAADIASKVITLDGATYSTSYSNFDAFGNPGTITESGPGGGSRTTTRTYLVNASPNVWILNVLKDEVAPGRSVLRTFDSLARLLSVSENGVVTGFTYDAQGNVATLVRPRNLVSSYSNYKRGIPRTEVQPEGIAISRTVSDAGLITSETDGEGHTKSYTYDGTGRLTSIDYPQGNDTSIVHTATTKTATRGGLVESTVFDGFGRRVKVTLGGVETNYSYDPMGQQRFESNPGSASVGHTYEYDAIGRVTKVTNADSTYTSYIFGAGSITVRDERANNVTYSFRGYGTPDTSVLMGVAAADPAANVTISRGVDDLVSSVTQAGVTRSFTYDSRMYLQTETSPETGLATYERDAAGNMTARITGGVRTDYAYDGQNRLTNVTYSDGTPSVTQTYSKTHRLKSVVTSFASRTLSYNVNDNLISEALTIEGVVFGTAMYGYNANDQQSSVTYPISGRVVTLSPDVLGRPTALSGYVSAVTYWPSGQIKQVDFVNGLVSSYDQNARLWPSGFQIRHGSTYYLASIYGYDGYGNLASIADGVEAALNRSLGYDNLNRLTSAAGPWGSGALSYDARGNIASQVFGSTSLSYGYDSQNRLGSVSGSRNSSYTYDSGGNVAVGNGATYTYDGVPNLRCINCATASRVEYTYDGLAKRVSTTKATVRTYEFRAQNGDLLVEYTPSSGNLFEYIYLGGKRVAQRRSDASPATLINPVRTTVILNSTNSVTLSVRVGGVAPGGTVRFTENGVLLGTAYVASGVATIEVQDLPLGAHNIVATYSGDASNFGNSIAMQIRVVNNLAWLPAVLQLLLQE